MYGSQLQNVNPAQMSVYVSTHSAAVVVRVKVKRTESGVRQAQIGTHACMLHMLYGVAEQAACVLPSCYRPCPNHTPTTLPIRLGLCPTHCLADGTRFWNSS